MEEEEERELRLVEELMDLEKINKEKITEIQNLKIGLIYVYLVSRNPVFFKNAIKNKDLQKKFVQLPKPLFLLIAFFVVDIEELLVICETLFTENNLQMEYYILLRYRQYDYIPWSFTPTQMLQMSLEEYHILPFGNDPLEQNKMDKAYQKTQTLKSQVHQVQIMLQKFGNQGREKRKLWIEELVLRLIEMYKIKENENRKEVYEELWLQYSSMGLTIKLFNTLNDQAFNNISSTLLTDNIVKFFVQEEEEQYWLDLIKKK